MNENDKPIRVAQVIGKLNAAGVEAVVNNYYRNIDHDLIQFDYFIDADSNCEPPKELKDMGARYYVIPPYQNLPQYMRELVRLFKVNKYQIVHVNMNTLAVFALCAAWYAKVPVRINHNHSTASKGETKRNILKYLLRPFAKAFATDYCACSRYAGEWLFGKKSVERGEVTIINNAIDLDRFRYNESIRKEVRKELGIEGKLVVGHVGRFCYQKNHDFLVDVFAEVHKNDPETILLLIGIGELVDEIKQKVHRLQLDDDVIFLGARADVNKLYQAMDIFVLPSRYEGLPVVGVEAQASGLPCLFSDAMTSDTKLLDSTHMLSLQKDKKDWAEEIQSLTQICRSDTTEMIKTGGFDIVKEAEKMEKYYNRMLNGNTQDIH